MGLFWKEKTLSYNGRNTVYIIFWKTSFDNRVLALVSVFEGLPANRALTLDVKGNNVCIIFFFKFYFVKKKKKEENIAWH